MPPKDGADWAWAALYRDLAGQVIGYLASRGAREPEDLASRHFSKWHETFEASRAMRLRFAPGSS